MSVLLQRMGLMQSGAGGAFTPADLFTGGEAGAWYDASDLSTLWTDSGRTTQVTSDGDSVGAWDDKSGNGHNITQSTAANKPLYKEVGGKSLVRFDGVDDLLFTTTAIGLYGEGNSTTGIGASGSNATGDYVFAEGNSTDNIPIYSILTKASATAGKESPFIRADDGTVLFPQNSSSYDTVSDWWDSGVFVGRVEDDGTAEEISYFLNGVEDGNSPKAYQFTRSGESLTVDRMAVGALLRGSAAVHASVDVYQLVVTGDLLSAGEASDLDDYIADKTGVTL